MTTGSERERLANRIRTGFRAMPAGRGADLAYGRRLPGLLRAGGHATEEEIERHLANVAAGGMDLATAPMVSAWGRRPG
ncbi:hypothetical protein [Planotetraspora kaengkrachanensis]|uniref:Uncharacterized protein n=1 Tax=Planotetraspora kaengkrachanensis TaxID=575193 RepID=A0A8J3LZX2_9ACTN|nr:hypothetical protein [Planotetraspora kaengkrachanensis]GIG79513.1 hypothetical protein Pka01_26400 [Planotetraspora kaengkrachanensis]